MAQQAADLLPPKSRAYAAVLCNAASWVIKRDAKTGRALYQRYINTGTRYRGRQNSATTARRRTSPPWRHNAEFQA